MRHARVIALAGLAVAVTAVAAYAAQTTVVPIPDNEPVQEQPLEVDLAKTHWGDAENGATVATPCAACLSADRDPPDPMYPRIGGRNDRYIPRQLARLAPLARRSRPHAVTTPFDPALTPHAITYV